ncbi:PTS beta-glucoside transporter subunit EIIBCA [Paenibacillus sp. BGI2013]|uniref:beta-glucoside-specific PTS transporter subunit IIABC n=1 Tax=Paenibacillus TaxID=44249 RepID=UPI00096E173D|nr:MULTISPECIES: beta-glucoside-specific PTS transporter subunit IIABC [Paenibacillus]OMF39382.1 PTS beta-glucoside transporter subunit EIIBCA [Paenibacillus amylolyticus]PKQ88268.1 PTS beta-glucoside transporter subunit EIIBCA [Paenibacillus sp. BGI2013]
MNNKDLAKNVLDLVGGEQNISGLTHCATRLRFVLKDDNKADLKALDQLEGVLKAQNSGGQVQVVIGAKVDAVYSEVKNLTSDKIGELTESTDSGPKKRRNPVNVVLETIAGIFTPVLPALVGCGMIKCLATVITAMGYLEGSGFLTIINMIGDCIFYFMPFFLAVSAANRFKTNPYLAVALAAGLMHPTILNAAAQIAETGVNSIDFLGMPILLMKYSSSVIPIILAVWIMSYVYPIVNRVIPKFLQVLLTPMIVLFIMIPVELIVLGPVGSYIGDWLTNGINSLFSTAGVLAGAILGFFKPIMVMFGMHYAIMPIQVQQVATLGATVLLPTALAANLAQAGAAFGVFVLTKSKTMKSAAASSGFTALFGITEPAIYGVTLKYKRPFFAGCLAGGLVGGFYSLVHTTANAISLPGVLAIGTYSSDRYMYVVIGCIAAVVLGFVFTLLAGIKEDTDGNKSQQQATNKVNSNQTAVATEATTASVSSLTSTSSDMLIVSPMTGEIKPISEVEDQAFAQELMGKGIAIVPTDGKVYAPFDGVVEALYRTKHAIGLKAANGVEILIHIGVDTVSLKGKYFNAHIEQGQTITAGDILVEFDPEGITSAGYNTITSIVVTNMQQYGDVLTTATSGPIRESEPLIKLIP